MNPSAKADLHRYLQSGRNAVLWKLDGVSEYDVRRPLTPTGTNLLGLVKHLASLELGYLGEVFDRPAPVPLPWFDDDAEPNADLWATAEETREQVLGLYRTAWQHADATIEALDLTDTGTVPHWPADRARVTLHQILTHLIAETHRHSGHADILRETIDGTAGMQPGNENMPETSAGWWQRYREHLEQVAREVGGVG
ncbi:MAG TPA: DinB family protein [Beutenbergiaceae bacterium]|nr:DinB family protein [Beutenbergiaceae bacterium]